MKLGILLGNDTQLTYETAMYGLALTWWRREWAPKWHVGCRFTLLLGKPSFGFRVSTYSFPRLSSRVLFPTSSKYVAKPNPQNPIFQ